MDVNEIKKALKGVQSIDDLKDIRSTTDKLLQNLAESELADMHKKENDLRALVGMKRRPLATTKKGASKTT